MDTHVSLSLVLAEASTLDESVLGWCWTAPPSSHADIPLLVRGYPSSRMYDGLGHDEYVKRTGKKNTNYLGTYFGNNLAVGFADTVRNF